MFNQKFVSGFGRNTIVCKIISDNFNLWKKVLDDDRHFRKQNFKKKFNNFQTIFQLCKNGAGLIGQNL